MKPFIKDVRSLPDVFFFDFGPALCFSLKFRFILMRNRYMNFEKASKYAEIEESYVNL